jgi:DNA primase
MKMHLQHGYKNTVAMLGHTISKGQLYQLYSLYKSRRDILKVYLFIDNDATGYATAENNIQQLQELGFINIYKMALQGVKDAAEASKEQVDNAYCAAELQPSKYPKKRIIIYDADAENKYVDEE